MSVVVAAITNGKIIMVGDTQLNHKEMGAIQATSIKVFPLDNYTLVGITGNFDSHIEIANGIKQLSTGLSFEDKINYVKNCIQKDDRDNNVIIATIESGITKFNIMGNEYGYNNPIEMVTNGADIKVLLPPKVTEEMCKPYIFSLIGIRQQVFSCIEAVSNWSDTVNNKMVGFEINENGCQLLTKNIKYEDVDYRIPLDILEV